MDELYTILEQMILVDTKLNSLNKLLEIVENHSAEEISPDLPLSLLDVAAESLSSLSTKQHQCVSDLDLYLATHSQQKNDRSGLVNIDPE